MKQARTAEGNLNVAVVCQLQSGEERAADIVRREAAHRLRKRDRGDRTLRSSSDAAHDFVAVDVYVKVAPLLLRFQLGLQPILLKDKCSAGP